MKIVYCIHSVYNPGGMERVLLNKVRWLSENTDWELIVVTTNQQGRPPFYDFPARVRMIDLDVNYAGSEDGNALQKICSYLKKRKLHRQRLSEFLFSEKADVVVSLFPSESSFIPKIKDGSKKVLELHFNRYFRLQYGRKGIIGLIDRIRTMRDKALARKFDKFVVLTESDRRNWGHLDNMEVISNAVVSAGEQISTLENKRVIAVGRLDYQKGFDRLIDIWNLLVNKYPQVADWRLDIFGQGEWKEMLENKIRTLGLERTVGINLPSGTIHKEYAESSILAMTSNYEGFGMVLVEAMTHGVPCVAFDCPCGPSDIIENEKNGLLVAPGDNDAFADALFRLMGSRKEREMMGKNAPAVKTTYSESSIMGKWTVLFNELKGLG